ncbi:12122_t:CDS:2, partial [Funneliformis caledonium]
VDSNSFNSIQLNEPSVNIRCDNGSSVGYNSKFREYFNKITMSPGISATSYIEIVKLQELLISRKDLFKERKYFSSSPHLLVKRLKEFITEGSLSWILLKELLSTPTEKLVV